MGETLSIGIYQELGTGIFIAALPVRAEEGML